MNTGRFYLVVLQIFAAYFLIKGLKTVLLSSLRYQNFLVSYRQLVVKAINQKSEKSSTELCELGHFRFDQMKTCHKWLECEDIDKIKGYKKKIGGGIGKLVYVVKWKSKGTGLDVSLALVEVRPSRVKQKWIVDRVQLGMKNLMALQPSKNVIQVAGFCDDGNQQYLLTELCGKYGSLDKFVNNTLFKRLSTLKKFIMAIQIVESFVFLHHNSGLSKVHCDLHDPKQALGQFLVTNDFRVVLNDVDELPTDEHLNKQFAICRAEPKCMMTNETFLAPEQRYTQDDCMKQNGEIAATIKADIWKIPDITETLLTINVENLIQKRESKNILARLLKIHSFCKIANPEERCTAKQILREYRTVLHFFRTKKMPS